MQFHRPLSRALETLAAASRWWKWLLVGLVVVVGYLALVPKPPAGVDLGWDKLNHVLAFAALAFCACLGYPRSRRTRVLLLWALLAYGGLIEVLQAYVPGRSSEWADLLADAIGIACGAAAAAPALRSASLLAAPR